MNLSKLIEGKILKYDKEANNLKKFFPQVQQALAAGFGDKGFKVVIGSNYAMVDLEEKVIHLPDMEEASWDALMIARGLIDHELGHVRYTENMALDEKYKEKYGMLYWKALQVLEDRRIDKKTSEKYPGAGYNLKTTAEILTPKILSERNEQLLYGELSLIEKEINDMFHAIYVKGAFGMETPFMKDNIFRELAVKYAKLDTRSSSDVKEVAKQLVKDVEKVIKKWVKSNKGDEKGGEKDGDDGKKMNWTDKKSANAAGHNATHNDKTNKDKMKGRNKNAQPGGGAHNDEIDKNEMEEENKIVSHNDDVHNDEIDNKIEEEKYEDERIILTHEEAIEFRKALDRVKENNSEIFDIVKQLNKEMKRSIGGRIYTYNDSADEVIIPESVDDWEYVNKFLEEIKISEMHFMNQIMRMYKQFRPLPTRRQKNGSIDPLNLYKVSLKEENLFVKKIRQEGYSIAYELLIDLSGSMEYYGRLELAFEAAIAFGKVLDVIGIPVEITGFTTEGYHFDDKVERSIPLRHYIFKNFNERMNWLILGRFEWFCRKKDRLTQENVDGEAVKWAGERLLDRKEKRKILIVLSDGAPAARMDGEILELNLLEEIEKLKKKNVDVMGIGIDTTAVKKFYENYIVISVIEELPNILLNKINETLEGTRVLQ